MNQNFPQLETKRLTLRQTTHTDAEAIFAIFSDPKVTQFHNLDTFVHIDEAIATIERRKKGFERDLGIRWGIARKQDNVSIGSCGFTWIKEANAAEIGYELDSQFWKQGIMSEALRSILHYGFENKGLDFVVAKVMLENLASKKLLEKLGFSSQGILKQHGFWKGKHHDLERFVLTK
jgi:[ribosomal protein S5]-alanine N-acetyltransferase